MKLLFIIKTLSQPGGGAERVLAEVSAGLANRGHEVTVASFDASGASDFYPFDVRLRRVRLAIGPSGGRSGAIVSLRRIAALRALTRRERPDVAVGFMHSAYVPLGVALVGSGTPVVASEHTIHDHYANRPAERLLLRTTAPLFATITAVTSAMRDTFPLEIRRRMVVICNPVRINRATASAYDRTTAGQRVLLTVGRLGPEKGQATLIAAFASISKRHPDWRLQIVGEGVLRPGLATQISDLGVSDQVTLAGPTNDIDSEFVRASLFVMPSFYESFGLATAEALSHGLPVIGFADCAGTNELIVDGVNGLLVDGEDRTKALAVALEQLMTSANLRRRMGQAGPNSVRAYRPAQIVEQWEALLQAAAERRRWFDVQKPTSE